MAIAVALITCFVIIPLGALAVDIGMQRVARADMQTVADLAATDMARILGAGTTPTAAMAAASAARDSGAVGATPTMAVYLGVVSTASVYTSDQNRGCGGSPYDSYFLPANGATPNAVVVTASTSVAFALHSGSGGTCRSALAQVSGTACYALGSYAAVVKSGNSSVLSPLNSIFGANLSLLSYQNIAGATVTLAQLAADSHIGTATQLMSGSITVSNLVLAMIDVLQQGSGNSAAVTALNSLLSVVAGQPSIQLSNLLSISPTDTAAMNTSFSALNILAGAVLLADGKHAVDIPNVWAGVAGTGQTSDASLYVQQGKDLGCGTPGHDSPTSNSQISGYVAFDKMNSPSINIGIANMKTGVGTGRLTLAIAQATGQLALTPPVVCGSNTTASPTTFSVGVTAALSSEQLLTQVPVSGTVTLAGLGAVSLNLTVDVTVSSTRPAGTATANISIPPNDTTPVSTGSGIALDYTTATTTIDNSASTATVLGLPISLSNPLLTSTLNLIISGIQSTFVTKTVNPLVTNLNTMVTGPIATLLGIEVGGADVYGQKTSCTNKPTMSG